MNILLNISNLNLGGGVQVAISFLNELKTIDNEYFYHVAISKTIYNQLDEDFSENKFKFYIFKKGPVRLIDALKNKSRLTKLESSLSPKVVFTLFGPSYWKPKSIHLMGFADPWVLNPSSKAYYELKKTARLKMRIKCLIKSYFVIKDSSFFVIETQDGKSKMSNLLNIDLDRIFVVGNSLNGIFNDKTLLDRSASEYIKLPPRTTNEYRLILISNLYPHKNLKVIKKVIPLLSDYNISFYLTIDQKSFENLFGDSYDNVFNLGPVSLKSCPSLYSQCNALFMPSLLEVFSTSFLEAMKMSLPILSSNLSFAKDICEDAALYFNPFDEIDISKKIIKLHMDSELALRLIKNGAFRLDNHESAKSRAKKYLEIIANLAKKNEAY